MSETEADQEFNKPEIEESITEEIEKGNGVETDAAQRNAVKMTDLMRLNSLYVERIAELEKKVEETQNNIESPVCDPALCQNNRAGRRAGIRHERRKLQVLKKLVGEKYLEFKVQESQIKQIETNESEIEDAASPFWYPQVNAKEVKTPEDAVRYFERNGIFL